MIVRAELSGQDAIQAEKIDGQWRIEALGCSRFLKRVRELSSSEPNPELWAVNLTSNDHVDILLREFAQKAQGQWQFPYKEEELCHCRGVSLKIVDEAILNGAHSPEAVSRRTSASTSCGTCRQDVKNIIRYRVA